MLPIGVVIPTRNCVGLVEKHLDSMLSWLPHVEQVVVVDSASTDGTPELLRKTLAHRDIEFLQHPPGLYESWNFGVSRVGAQYTYIATAGDAITLQGLDTLCRAAKELGADVVLSKPRFCGPDGTSLPDETWAVDEVIRSLQVSQPRRLTRIEALLFALTSVSSALTGSCASDLFRTKPLQEHPFSAGYGSAGDGAWGIENALNVSWAVVPDRFSQFVRHPKTDAPRKSHGLDGPRFESLARQVVESGLAQGLLTPAEMDRFGLQELLEVLSDYLKVKAEFDIRRRQTFPWILSLDAWGARKRRNQFWERLSALRDRALRQINNHGEHR